MHRKQGGTQLETVRLLSTLDKDRNMEICEKRVSSQPEVCEKTCKCSVTLSGALRIQVANSPSSSLRVSVSPMLRVARLASNFSVLNFSYNTSLVRILSICINATSVSC